MKTFSWACETFVCAQRSYQEFCHLKKVQEQARVPLICSYHMLTSSVIYY